MIVPKFVIIKQKFAMFFVLFAAVEILYRVRLSLLFEFFATENSYSLHENHTTIYL